MEIHLQIYVIVIYTARYRKLKLLAMRFVLSAVASDVTSLDTLALEVLIQSFKIYL
jgi:hypothetical protein